MNSQGVETASQASDVLEEVDADWWRQAVVYQIYPRSFKDSSGSGLGDIRGITSKIDYLKWLGVDAVWLSPFYPSQLADGGYDVDDYRNVDPKLGTMDDFDDMAHAAHTQGIKVIVDIVPNHSSNEHPWFLEAVAAGKGSAARERYIFRDGRGKNGELPPTDWAAHFGGAAWTQVPDGQWYLHLFTKEQPDWNWKNDEVHEDFKKTLRFWSDHGADGFRIDAAHTLAKDIDRDDIQEFTASSDVLPSDGSNPLFDRNEVHDIYKEWRTVFNEYDPPRFAVAEAWVNPDRQYLYASADELGQIFNFEFAKKNWTRDEMVEAITSGLSAAEASGSTSTWVMSNHDVVRHASRYGLPQIKTRVHHQLSRDWLLRDGLSYFENRELGTRRARAAILLELGLPGSAYIYQGEELGLFEVADLKWEDLEDPYPFNTFRDKSKKGRDGCRVPLPWSSENETFNSLGFSPAHKTAGAGVRNAEVGDVANVPHLPQPDWYRELSVDREMGDPDSMLALYRRALEIRHNEFPVDTDLVWLDENQSSGVTDGAEGSLGGAIAYRRSNGIAVFTNFGSKPLVLPDGDRLVSSQPLDEKGRLTQDSTIWIQLE